VQQQWDNFALKIDLNAEKRTAVKTLQQELCGESPLPAITVHKDFWVQ